MIQWKLDPSPFHSLPVPFSPAYELTDQDIREIKDEGTIKDAIISDIHCKDGAVSGELDHFSFSYFGHGNMFYAFGSLRIKYKGTVTVGADGTRHFKGKINLWKRYNFDLDHWSHWIGFLADTNWQAARFLQVNNQAQAFELDKDQWFDWDFDLPCKDWEYKWLSPEH